MTSPGGVNIATAYIQLVPSVAGIQGAVGQAFGGAEAEADAAGQRAGGLFTSAAAKWLVSGAAVAGVAAGFKQLFDVGETFDSMEDTIRVRTGQIGTNLTGLQEVARNVATTVPTDFQRAADVVSDLNQTLGLSGTQLQTVASQVTEAGRLMGQEVNVKDLSASLSGFNVAADQTDETLDTLFRVSQSTGVGINDLTSSLSTQGGVLQSLGFSLSDSASLIGTLDKAGVSSTTVVKSMSAGLLKLTKDGEQPADAFKRVTSEIQGFVDAGDEASALQRAGEMFGTRGAPQLIAALKTGKIDLQDMTAAAQLGSDTILGLASETNDGAESWTLFKNKALDAMEPVGTAVYNLAGKGLKALADGFDPVMAKAGAAWDVLRSGEFAGAQAGIGEEDSPLVRGLILAHDLAGEAKDALGGLWATLSPIFAQVGGTLGTAFLDVWESLKPALEPLLPLIPQLLGAFNPIGLIFKALIPVLPQIADLVAEVAGLFGDFLAKALVAVTPLLETIVSVIDQFMPMVADLVTSLLPPLSALFEAVAPAVSAILDALMPLVQLLAESLIPIIEALMPSFKLVFEFIGETLNNFIGVVTGVIDIITGIFTGDWSKVWEGVKEVFGAIWDQIVNILSTALDLFIEFFTNLGPRIWDTIVSISSTIVSWGTQFLQWLWDGIVAIADDVWDWFLGVPGFIWERIKDFGAALGGYGASIIGWIKDGIVTGASAIWDWLSGGINDPNSLLGGIWAAIQGVGSFVISIGKAFVGWIVQGIAEVASDIWDAITSVFKGDQIVGASPGSAEDPIAAALTQYTAASRGGAVGFDRGGKADGGPIQWLPTGRVRGPGGPRDDVIPTMLSNGEYVMNADATAEWFPLLEQLNWGRMADGGLAAAGAAAKMAGSHIALLYGKAVRDQLLQAGSTASDSWLASTVSQVQSKFAPVYNVGAGVEQWRGLVLQALAITGQSAAYADTVLHQMQTESSGNPQAINLTDINAQRGIPSKGLMQVIDPTFRSYAAPGYSSNIYDPLSNIIASIRYVLARYGSIPAGMRGVAYDEGGWLEPGGSGVNLLSSPEPVLSPAQWNIAERAIGMVAEAGVGGDTYYQTTIHHTGPDDVGLERAVLRAYQELERTHDL